MLTRATNTVLTKSLPSYEATTEAATIGCFVSLVYKLTEKEFLPLLMRLLEWSRAGGDKAATFYNLTACLSDKLQALFLLFGGSIFLDLVDQLKACKPAEVALGRHYFTSSSVSR